MLKKLKALADKATNKLFEKAPKDELTIDELVDRLMRGIRIEDMPRFVVLDNGRRLDVTNQKDAAELKLICRGGNRRQRRSREAAKRHG